MTKIFELNIETNLSEFDTLLADGGDLYHDTPGLVETAGRVAMLIDDQNILYAQKNITLSTPAVMAYRFYFDPNSVTMADGDTMTIAWIRLSGSPWYQGQVEVRKNGANYELRAMQRVETGDGWSSWFIIPDDQMIIEVRCLRATSTSSNDGELKLWIDELLKATIENMDSYDYWTAISSFRVTVENVDAGTSGTIYFDEIVLNDDGNYIGVADAAPELQPVSLARMVQLNYTYFMNYSQGMGDNVLTLSETTIAIGLTLFSTFATFKELWVGYDGFDFVDDIQRDLVQAAIGELIPE